VPATAPDADENALREVLAHLRTRTGRDFSYYKRATVVRRISRRMQVNGTATLPDYLSYLRTHPGELGALQQDLLISVTNFFRDREAFAALEAELPAIFAGKGPSDVVRVWSAGCATGEEAYSIAMLLLEQTGRMDSPPSIQVFASDLDEGAIAAARAGLYPFASHADISEERLRRFFVKEHGGYRARRELRECVLFAVHDLLRDAPFSRLDLFTCRNLLIYLTAEAQERVFNTAHFALRSEGRLFIGTSESVDEESPFWRLIDTKHRLYRRRPATRAGLPVPIGPTTLTRALEAQERAKGGPFIHGGAFSSTVAAALQRDAVEQNGRRVSWEELHFKLIERFAPPSLIVTRDHDIVHMSENAGQFLHFSGGEPSVNLLAVVHPMLRIELRGALFRAAQTSTPVEVFRVPVELEAKAVTVDIRVSPAQEIAPDYLLVVFAVREDTESAAVQARQEAEPAVRYLEREIEQTKTRLRDTIEQYEASSEELKASNEELQAMNEELRSSAEELETSREELQSVNEELTTVNHELKTKVEDLVHANADLANLMTATGVATIFLDRALRITRFTPGAVTLFRLISTDLGRPLTDMNHRLNYPELKQDAERVLELLVPIKREVTDGERWFLSQLLPYRTADDHIAGVVLTFVDITDARHVSQALLASETRLQLAVEATRLAVFDWNLETDQLDVNERFRELFSLDLDEKAITAPLIEQRVHPDDRAGLRRTLESAFNPAYDGRYEAEFRVLLPDGQQRWLFANGQVYFEGKGAARRAVRVFGTDLDITERRQAEESLRANEEQFRRAIEDAPIPVIMHTEDGQILQISKIWTDLTGYTPADIPTFDVWLNRAYGAAAAEVRERVQKLFRSDERLLDAELEITTRSGEQRRWAFSASAPGTLRDGRRFIVAMALDITERTQIQEALRASQERLRLIVENAREYAIFSLDLDRRVTSWNSGAQAILGYAPEEVLGQSADLIFTPEDRAAGAPALEAHTAVTKERASDERWHLRKDGSRFWGSGVMMAMRDAAGEAIGLVKIFRDQTAELHAKQALEEALQENERARAETEAASRAKDHFLAVLSHELRTPLTPVLMATATLERRDDLPEPVREALVMIRRNVQLESRFVDDLLDVTKIARGKMELERTPMDLHEAVTHAVEVSQSEIDAREQQLTVALKASRHRLEGDPQRLQQVVWNLLKNASKFTPKGGKIRISTRNEPGCLLVEVSDTGIGIEAEALPRIFEAFIQADASITREYGGLGLGLAIAKAIVLSHGGELRVESAGHGCGAKFIVSLPLPAAE
jgi:two-component system CheB/CheR fusion protein